MSWWDTARVLSAGVRRDRALVTHTTQMSCTPLPSNPFPSLVPAHQAYKLALEIESCPPDLLTTLKNHPLLTAPSVNLDMAYIQLLGRVLGYILLEFNKSGSYRAASEIIDCPDHRERIKLAVLYVDYLIRPCQSLLSLLLRYNVY